MILYLIRGLPGSGKSTYAKKLGCLVLECDMFRIKDGVYNPKANANTVKKSVNDMCGYALSKGVDVAVTGVFSTRKSLEDLIAFGKNMGATVKIIKMTGNFENIHNVPVIAVRGFKKRWEDIDGEIIENV